VHLKTSAPISNSWGSYPTAFTPARSIPN
jgi:hypothetical protein